VPDDSNAVTPFGMPTAHPQRVFSLDDSGCRRSWLLTVLCRFSAVCLGGWFPAGGGAARCARGGTGSDCAGAGLLSRVAGTGVAGHAGRASPELADAGPYSAKINSAV
jgi:hypothetical protein